MTEQEQMQQVKTQMLGMLAEENIEYVTLAQEVCAAFVAQAKVHIDSVTELNEKGAVLVGIGLAMIELHSLDKYIPDE